MDEIAKEINKGIKESFVYKRYLFCKDNVESNQELLNKLNEMKCLKNINCKERKEELINKYYQLEKEYKNNILVKELEKAEEDLYSLLSDVSDILTFK